LRIAIQGEPGSFSHEAALKARPEATILSCTLSGEVFAAVDEARRTRPVIPIENSLAGSVLEHYDLLLARTMSRWRANGCCGSGIT